ncbi:MAG: DUF177 domain-containing protein [Bacteroidota bacterium]
MKDTLKQFVIPFSGLKLGNYAYQFILDNTFFEYFENEDIKDANVIVDLQFEKKPNMLILDFSLQGSYNVTCSRCLQNYDQTVDGEERIIVKFGKENEDEPDIIFLPFAESKIDVRNVLYEIAILLLPMVYVHPENEIGISQCDPEMLQKLSELSPKNKPDSQWDQLKNLLN